MKLWRVNGRIIPDQVMKGKTICEGDVVEEGRFVTNEALMLMIREIVKETLEIFGIKYSPEQWQEIKEAQERALAEEGK